MNKKTQPWTKVQNSLIDECISSDAFRLYIKTSSLSNLKGYCFATNDYLVKSLKLSKSKIIRALNELELVNYIKREIIYYEGSKKVKERRIYCIYGDKPKTTYKPYETNDIVFVTEDQETEYIPTSKLKFKDNLVWK